MLIILYKEANMIKSRLASFIDSCIIAIISLVFELIIIGYFIDNLLIKIIIASTISSCFFILYLKHEKKKYSNQKLKISEKNLAKEYNLHIKFMDTRSKIAFFTNLFTKYTKKKNILNFGFNIDNIQGVNKPLILQNIIDKFSKKKYDIFFVIVNEPISVFDEIKTFANAHNFNIQIITNECLYIIMKEINCFPKQNNTKEILKISKDEKIKTFFHNLFKRKNSKSFLVAGLSLVILSHFIPFSNHYKYFGYTFLILSLISLFAGNPRLKNNINV